MSSQPVACSRCLDRDARRLAADRRAEFCDSQLNWLTVRLQGRLDGEWATFVECHRFGDKHPLVGMPAVCEDRDEAVRRFRELVRCAFEAAWTPVHGAGLRNVDPAVAFAAQV